MPSLHLVVVDNLDHDDLSVPLDGFQAEDQPPLLVKSQRVLPVPIAIQFLEMA